MVMRQGFTLCIFAAAVCNSIANEWAIAEHEIRAAFAVANWVGEGYSRRLQPSNGPSTGPSELTIESDADWYLVDTTSIVCLDIGAPGISVINISLAELSAEHARSPHILTFYRTSPASTSVTFSAEAEPLTADVTSRRIVAPNTVILEAAPAEEPAERRLESGPDFDAEGRGVVWGAVIEEDGDRWFDEPWAVAGEPGSSVMDGRVLRGGGGRSSGSRSSSSSSSSSRSSSSSASRSSAQPSYTRRRGAPPSTAARRRSTGVGGGTQAGRFSNAQCPSGAYGYTSSSRMQSNYGGATPRPVSYGYSGHGAYRANSMQSVRIRTAGVAGAAFMFARPRYHGSRRSCRGQEDGSDRACAHHLDEDATRDDLMTTGFIPADYDPSEPLTVMVTEISGADFGEDRICPPAGFDPDGRRLQDDWAPPERQDLFVTLTRLEELEDTGVTSFASRCSPVFVFCAAIAGFGGPMVLELGLGR